MSSLYPDLVNKFDGETLDPLRLFKDVDIENQPYVTQFYIYYNQGDFSAIQQLFIDHPDLKNMIINAESMQYIYDMSISLQRFYLNDVRSYIMYLVQNKGEYVNTTQYTKYNVVSYNGLVFMASELNVPIGASPLDSVYWIPLAIKGDKGVSGLGLSPRGLWNNFTQYYKDDFISWNNTFWYAINDNINSEPTELNSNWISTSVTDVRQLYKIAEIEHNLNKHPDCTLFTFNNGAGMSGAGETGAGGGILTKIDFKFELDDINKVIIYVLEEYSNIEYVYKVNDNMYTMPLVNSNISLVLMLR